MLYRFDEAEVLVSFPRILKGPTAQVWKARGGRMVDMVVVRGFDDRALRFMLKLASWKRMRSHNYVIDEEGTIWNTLPIEKGPVTLNLTPGLSHASVRSISVAISQPARIPPRPAQMESLYQLIDYILGLVPTIEYLNLGRELSPRISDPWGLDGETLRIKYGLRDIAAERVQKSLLRKERMRRLDEYREILERMSSDYKPMDEAEVAQC